MSINTLHEKAEQQHDKVSQEIFEVLSADINNLPKLKNIVKKAELGLKDVLGDDILVISNKNKSLIEKTKNKFVGNTLRRKLNAEKRIQNAIATDNTYTRKARDLAGDNELKLQDAITYLGKGVGSKNKSREEEYSDLWDCIGNFPHPDEKEKQLTGIDAINLNALPEDKDINMLTGVALGTAISQNTKLLNIDGTEVQEIKNDKYKIKLRNKEGNLQEYIFDKIKINQNSDGTRIHIVFDTGFKIYKSDGKTIADDLDLKNIELGFETTISHTGLDQKVAQRKTLKLELKLPINTDAQRKYQINSMRPDIESNLNAIYDSSFKKIKKEAISEVISSWGLNEFNSLSEEEKDECIKALGLIISKNEVTDFGRFKDFLAKEKDSLSHEYSHSDYRSYIASNIQKKIKKWMKKKISNIVENSERYSKSVIISFLGNLEKSKTDNPDERINARTFMNSHINTIMSEMKKKNYMRFYSNEEHPINGQKVNIDGEEGKTFDYDMNLKVLSPTSFMLELTVDGVKKTYASDSHYSLVEQVLGNYEIQSDKARLHIAYNIYKSMLGIAQKRGLKLTRKKGNHRRTLLLENGNIKATNWELRNNRTSDYKNLFDEKEFQASSNMGDYRKGLQDLAMEFHTINQTEYKQHRKATKWKWLLNRHRFAAKKLPGRWYFSPIKFLLNKNRNLDFEFDTNLTIPSVGEGSEEKNISIKFEKNKFTLSDGEKTFSGFDLRRILRKSQFIDSDRRIYAEVYKNLITKLRTNTTIKNRSYYAFDEGTQRTYIINSNGQVGYIPKEDKSIGKKNIFGKNKKRGVIDGQIHTMRVLDNPDNLYQDPYLMNKIIKSMNRSLRTGAAKDIIPDWMKSQKLKR